MGTQSVPALYVESVPGVPVFNKSTLVLRSGTLCVPVPCVTSLHGTGTPAYVTTTYTNIIVYIPCSALVNIFLPCSFSSEKISIKCFTSLEKHFFLLMFPYGNNKKIAS